MSRLSFGVMTAKEDRSIEDLYHLLTTGPISADLIFVDTGFVTTRIHEQFWELFPHQVLCFTEFIVAELSGWTARPIHNSYLHNWLPRAIEECEASDATQGVFRSSRVLASLCNRLTWINVGLTNRNVIEDFGFDYYVNLLSLRKLAGVRVSKELLRELGREPTENEVRNRLNHDLHQRIAPIAFKGWKDRHKRNFLADEELVVSAVLTAILTGETTAILTRDTDVFEQFTKLFELLTNDYACYRFGIVRHFSPKGVPMFPLSISPGAEEPHGFLGTEVEHVVLPRHEVERLPPSTHTPVHCFCVLVGNTCDDPKISIVGVCLEREMDALLEVKSKATGRNTEYFGNKNVIAGVHVQPDRNGILFTLGEELIIDYEGVQQTWYDVQRAMKGDPLLQRHNILY